MCALKANKISPETAKTEFAKCTRLADCNIKAVRAREEQLEKAEIAALNKRRKQTPLDEVICTFREYPLWKEWLCEQKKKLFRQKLFVINGPSRMGKSKFVLAMLKEFHPQHEVLMCNCMNVQDPDLRDYRVLTHGSVLFDEGGPEMIQRHRDLFQAPQHDIRLAHSATGCYSYTVNLWQKPLVVTCNGWQEELEKLSCANKEWVVANTVVLDVSTPMWEQSAPRDVSSEATGEQRYGPPPLNGGA